MSARRLGREVRVMRGLLEIHRDNVTPFLRLRRSDLTADQRQWDFRISNGGELEIRSVQDNGATVFHALSVVHANGEIEPNGDLDHDGSNVGFYGAVPVAQPAITGSRASNDALANLLSALEDQGLVVDNTTAL